MLPFKLSAHAQQVILEREIKEEWIENVLSSPSKVEPDKKDSDLTHSLGTIPEYGHRVLRVVYNLASQTIVTVYFDRKQKGKL